MSLPQSDIVYLSERGVAHQVAPESGMTCVVLPQWPIPSGLDRDASDLLIRLSPAIQMLLPTCGGSTHQFAEPTARNCPPRMFPRRIWSAVGSVGRATSIADSGSSWSRWTRELPRSNSPRVGTQCACGHQMTTTLVLPQQIADELFEATSPDVETAGVLLARRVETPGGNVRLLARAMHWVPDDAYRVREAAALSIASHGYVPALGAAEADESVPIWLHTHPGYESSPRPSRHDKVVDREIADLFRLRSGSPFYGSVVVARPGRHLCFTGHIESADGHTDIDRLWATGRRFALTQNWFHKTIPLSDQFNRNVRAFGGDVQRVLGDLQVAVVGCGGTGAAVIEQLVRLGVRHLRLFDPDTLTASNLTRVYGSFPEDIGKLKVNVSAAHVSRIAPDAKVLVIQDKITLEPTAKLLLDADVIFGCTDDNAGRLVLSRIASYLLTPVIDCGVLLSSGGSGPTRRHRWARDVARTWHSVSSLPQPHRPPASGCRDAHPG